MRIKYLHKLEYKYEEPVQLGEHRLCIKPRSNGFQKLKNFELKITPEPEIIYPLLAASGEEINRIRFNGLTDNLIIESISEVETIKHPNIIDGVKNRYLTLVSSSKSDLTSVITGNFIGKNNLENTLSWEIKPLKIK